MIKLRLLIFLFLAMFVSACVTSPDAIVTRPVLVERAESYVQSGLEYYQRYEYLEAQSQFQKALYEYQAFNAVEGQARCNLNLAKTAIALGDYDDARKYLSGARKIIQAHSLHDLAAYIDIMDSTVLIAEKKYEAALNIVDGYFSGKKDYGKDRARIEAAILLNRVRIALELKQDEVQWLERFKQLVKKDMAKYEARLLQLEARLEVNKQQYSSALEKLGQALGQYRVQANPKGVSSTLRDIGEVSVIVKDWEVAERSYEDALLVAYKIKDRAALLESVESLQVIYRQLEKENKLEKIQQLKNKITQDNKIWYLRSYFEF